MSAAFNAADNFQRRLNSEAERDEALAALIGRVELRPDALGLTIALRPLAGMSAELTRDVPLKIKRRGVEMRFGDRRGDHPRDPAGGPQRHEAGQAY